MSDKYMVSDLSAFEGDATKVGVGYKFSGFDDGEIAVREGDIAVFDDPDAGMHAGGCELIHSYVVAAYVQCVYAVEYSFVDEDGYAVEVGTHGGLGRLGVNDRYVGIVTDGGGVYGGMNENQTKREADALRSNDDAQKYISYERHLGEDGTPADLWDRYDESDRSGRGCPYCTGEEGQDGTRIEVE